MHLVREAIEGRHIDKHRTQLNQISPQCIYLDQLVPGLMPEKGIGNKQLTYIVFR